MLGAKVRHDRHTNICVQHRCSLCPVTEPDVPSSCPIKVLHLLEVPRFNGNVAWAPRRSGKTTEVIKTARSAARRGERVVIAVPNHQQAELIRNILKEEANEEHIDAMSIRSANNKIGRKDLDLVLVDEVSSLEVEDARRLARLIGARFGGGLSTNV